MQLDLSDIHFHDTEIKSVIEATEEDTLIFDVSYPVNWNENRFEPRKLIFEDALYYSIHEGPFLGSPTILGVSQIGAEDGRAIIRIDTNAGFRSLHCTAVKLKDSKGRH